MLRTNGSFYRSALKGSTIAVAAVAVAVGVASCSSSSEPPPPPPSTSESPSVNGVPLRFEVTVSPAVTRESTLGDNESQVVGVQVLEGRTVVNEYSVRARLMYTMDFQDGEGPIEGFLELAWNDGTVIAARLKDGKATANDDGVTTSLDAMLEVVNGAERAAGVSGDGSVSGEKSSTSSSSSSLVLTVDLNLAGAPNEITGDELEESTSPSPTDDVTSTSSASRTATLEP